MFFRHLGRCSMNEGVQEARGTVAGEVGARIVGGQAM